MLEFRAIEGGGTTKVGTPIPRSSVRVFTYEGQPAAVRVTAKGIAVDYGRSGVLFDRRSGQLSQRLTVADGWPKRRPAEFPPDGKRVRALFMGPGVLNPSRFRYDEHRDKAATHAAAVEIAFSKQHWRAAQPKGFLNNLGKRAGGGWDEQRKAFASWTAILSQLNRESYVEAEPPAGGESRRFTMADGLASNIVTHFAVAEGKLWAACVDIYDPVAKEWGPGGLCCYDPAAGRWARVDTLAGRPVRWVTLLQVVGETLWVGFREGKGVEGDKVTYGMGLYPGWYRPKASKIVLARLEKGAWKTFARAPLPADWNQKRSAPDPARRASSKPPATLPSSTETPRHLTVVGGKVLLYSQTHARSSGNWDMHLSGHVWLLDPADGSWRGFSLEQDFGAYELVDMVSEGGETLVLSDRGVHRWRPAERTWAFLDTGSPIVNPGVIAAAVVGRELWIGCTNQSFGVTGRQGISRFDEKKLRWSYTSPKQIGTACPIQNIVPAAGGEVYVLLRPRRWMAAAWEHSIYPAQPWDAPRGVARYANGRWEFPARLEGVPDKIARERQGPNGLEKWEQPVTIGHLVGVQGKVFLSTRSGVVYEGPGKWKPILTLTGIHRGYHFRPRIHLRPSTDGKSLDVWHVVDHEDGPSKKVCDRYDLASGRWRRVEKDKSTEAFDYYSLGEVRFGRYGREWQRDWTALPTAKSGRYAVGPLSSQRHAVFETPWAVWLISGGELIRLDRAALAEWLGAPRE